MALVLGLTDIDPVGDTEVDALGRALVVAGFIVADVEMVGIGETVPVGAIVAVGETVVVKVVVAVVVVLVLVLLQLVKANTAKHMMNSKHKTKILFKIYSLLFFG